MAAGQAAATLHSMGVLQAYQADVLKELDEELRRATYLTLRATKHKAWAVGSSMAGLVSVERHLWHTLTDIKEKDKTFLLDTPISNEGLFGNSVTTVVEEFWAAKQQSAAFQQLIPCRSREVEVQPFAIAYGTPHKEWGPRSHPIRQLNG